MKTGKQTIAYEISESQKRKFDEIENQRGTTEVSFTGIPFEVLVDSAVEGEEKLSDNPTAFALELSKKMVLPCGTKNRGEVKVYESIDDLAVHLTEYVALLSEKYVKERGRFTVALSGGSFINLLGKLSRTPYDKTVDWRKWYIFWADERVVSRNHADSNYRLSKEVFISKVPVLSSHMNSIKNRTSAKEAARDYEFILRQAVKTRVINVLESSDCPKFDLILLGMGSDGHVAALFPGHRVLDVKGDWVTYLTDSPIPPPERITFTLPVINSASNVAVVVTGETNVDVVNLAIDDGDVGEEGVLPAKMVNPTDGDLVWFLDRPPVSRLDADADTALVTDDC